jgi:SPP1 family predicted phage head-tail adaptor
MRHRVTLQQPSRTLDAGGGGAITWSDVEQIWAEVKPVSSGERMRAMAIANPVTHRISLRYRADILPSWRCVYDGRNFAIRSLVDPTEKKMEMTLLVEEGVGT